ncbi:MAG: hypothetical protein HFJ45_00295 [Clostridia bacterium]|nr:hypothetical protein [Clostridia bacterium]
MSELEKEDGRAMLLQNDKNASKNSKELIDENAKKLNEDLENELKKEKLDKDKIE